MDDSYRSSDFDGEEEDEHDADKLKDKDVSPLEEHIIISRLERSMLVPSSQRAKEINTHYAQGLSRAEAMSAKLLSFKHNTTKIMAVLPNNLKFCFEILLRRTASLVMSQRDLTFLRDRREQ